MVLWRAQHCSTEKASAPESGCRGIGDSFLGPCPTLFILLPWQATGLACVSVTIVETGDLWRPTRVLGLSPAPRAPHRREGALRGGYSAFFGPLPLGRQRRRDEAAPRSLWRRLKYFGVAHLKQPSFRSLSLRRRRRRRPRFHPCRPITTVNMGHCSAVRQPLTLGPVKRYAGAGISSASPMPDRRKCR